MVGYPLIISREKKYPTRPQAEGFQTIPESIKDKFVAQNKYMNILNYVDTL